MADILTKNKEDYLNEIYRLQAAGNCAVKNSDIARKLNVTKPSVTEMLKKLSSEKLITFSEKKGVTLTKEGITKARITLRKHQLLEVFFKNFLNIKSHFHNEAHKVEHELSDEASNKLQRFLKNPELCPDGHLIPKKGSKIAVLNKIPLNKPVRVIFSNSDNKSIIERLNSLGIVPQTKVILRKRMSHGPIILDVKGSEIALGADISSNIYVEMD